MNNDPDTDNIIKICKSLIGSEISFNYSLKLKDNSVISNKLLNCNIVGDCLETILFPLLKKKIPTMEVGPKQSSPDFWNRNRKYEWELKTFMHKPNFDISNFTSYVNQLSSNSGVMKKLNVKYIIYKYHIDKNNKVIIDDCKICNVWDLISYNGKRPISIQCKKNMWYTIRPCSFNNIGNIDKTSKKFIQKMCDAIDKCPNNIQDKNNIIKKINKQYFDFNYKFCLTEIENLKI